MAPEGSRPPTPRTRRRQLRVRRRALATLVVLGPGLLLLVEDVLRRPAHIRTFDEVHTRGWLASIAASLVFWAILLYAAAVRRGIVAQAAAGIFVTLYALASGVQAAFFALYNSYLGRDGQLWARSLPQSILGHLPLARPGVLLRLLAALFVAVGFVVAARRCARVGAAGRLVGPILVPVALVTMTLWCWHKWSEAPASYRGWQSTSPDIIYFHGIVAQIREQRRETDEAPLIRVQRRRPEHVPAMTAKPARPRNVLFILQESLRYDVCCNDPEAAVKEKECATPFSHAVTPDRISLHQTRANASTTAISISNLWSGVPSHLGFDDLESVPLLWEYAHAAGWHTAYWTAQHVMFHGMRLYVQDLPLDVGAVATELDPYADFDAGAYDSLLTERVIADWDKLEEPFFAVVHYSNVHFPYVYDRKHAPWQPAAFVPNEAARNEEFLNYYKDVAYYSDIAVANLLEHVHATDKGARTVILYTSDHAEAFREHWQRGHTSSLYDDEIHVPGWIEAPPGTLSAEEDAAVRGSEQQLVWHFDFCATMLDLMGLWDAPEMQPFRRRMIGNPITRPERTLGPVPLNNCTWIWECEFRNWGLMQGPLKVEAREWDTDFHCFDVLADPLEQNDLGEEACAPLPDLAREMFGPMPAGKWPPGKDIVWGPAPPSASGSAAPP
jgi:glucan phosphoethanolaminetransferase (alkaline phosphatase superfamily)